jgi:hypothetical protein
VYQQRELLRRLLEQAAGSYDDLVVVHDGPDTADVKSVVERADGRFFERPRAFQQEPHWPFSWEQARSDWILRLDADEFPSKGMKSWLHQFRTAPEPPEFVSGFTCIWPLWNGTRSVSKFWPAGRNFLFHRHRVRFFGMVEQVPVADVKFEALPLILEHQPLRKSYGLKNVLLREHAHQWRQVIALSLLGKPTDLPCWRWKGEVWPANWEQIRQHPMTAVLRKMPREVLRALRDQWRMEKKFFPLAAISGPLHHLLIGFELSRLRRKETARRGG